VNVKRQRRRAQWRLAAAVMRGMVDVFCALGAMGMGVFMLGMSDLLGQAALLGLWPLLAGVLSLVSMAHDMWVDPGMDW
jgi:hypothetical protein